jgi:hypothetical protein
VHGRYDGTGAGDAPGATRATLSLSAFVEALLHHRGPTKKRAPEVASRGQSRRAWRAGAQKNIISLLCSRDESMEGARLAMPATFHLVSRFAAQTLACHLCQRRWIGWARRHCDEERRDDRLHL